jgi:hypothetical protein
VSGASSAGGGSSSSASLEGTYNSSDLSLSNAQTAPLQLNNQGKLKVIMNDSVGVYTDDNAGTSTLANDADANTQSVEKRSTVAVDLSGTWTGKANFEARISDTTSYVPVKLINVTTGVAVSSPTVNGQYVGSIAGFRDFRVRFGKSTGSLFTSIRVGIGSLTPITRLLTPSVVALARTVDATISASTEITLNAATTIIRVYALDKDVYMKWGTADVTAANFDEVIPANQVCDFYVPVETGTTLFTAVNFIERAATAGMIVIEK